MLIVTHRLLISLLLLLQWFFNVHATNVDVSGLNEIRKKFGGDDIGVIENCGYTRKLAEELGRITNDFEGAQTSCVHRLVFTQSQNLCGSSACIISFMDKFYENPNEDDALLAENQMNDFLGSILTKGDCKDTLDYEDVQRNYTFRKGFVAKGTAPSYLDYNSITSPFTSRISVHSYITPFGEDGDDLRIVSLIVYISSLFQNCSSTNVNPDDVRGMVDEFRSKKCFTKIRNVTRKLSIPAQARVDLMTYVGFVNCRLENGDEKSKVVQWSCLQSGDHSYITTVAVPTNDVKDGQVPMAVALGILFNVSNTAEELKLSPWGLSSDGAIHQKLSIADPMLLAMTNTLGFATFTIDFAIRGYTLVVLETTFDVSVTEKFWVTEYVQEFLSGINGLRGTHLVDNVQNVQFDEDTYRMELNAVEDKAKHLNLATWSAIVFSGQQPLLVNCCKVEKATSYKDFTTPQRELYNAYSSLYSQAKESGYPNISSKQSRIFPEIVQPRDTHFLSKEKWVTTAQNNNNNAEADQGDVDKPIVLLVSDNFSIVDLVQILNRKTDTFHFSLEGSDHKNDVFTIITRIYNDDYVSLPFNAVNFVLNLHGRTHMTPPLNWGTNFGVEGFVDNDKLLAPGKCETTSVTGTCDDIIFQCLSAVPANISDPAILNFALLTVLVSEAFRTHNLVSWKEMRFGRWTGTESGMSLAALRIKENKSIPWFSEIRKMTNLNLELDDTLSNEAEDYIKSITYNSKDKQRHGRVEEDTTTTENLQVDQAPPCGSNFSSAFGMLRNRPATLYIYEETHGHVNVSNFINAMTTKVSVSNLLQPPTTTQGFLTLVNYNSEFDFLHLCNCKLVGISVLFENGVAKGFCIVYNQAQFRDMGKILFQNTVGWTTAFEANRDSLNFEPQVLNRYVSETSTEIGLLHERNCFACFQLFSIDESETSKISMALVNLVSLLSVDPCTERTETEVSTLPTFEILDVLGKTSTCTNIDLDIHRRLRKNVPVKNFFVYSDNYKTGFVIEYELPDQEKNAILIGQFDTQIWSWHGDYLRYAAHMQKIAVSFLNIVESQILGSNPRFEFSLIVMQHFALLVALFDVEPGMDNDIMSSFVTALTKNMSKEPASFTEFDLSSLQSNGFRSIQSKGICSINTIKKILDTNSNEKREAGFHDQTFGHNSKLCVLCLGQHEIGVTTNTFKTPFQYKFPNSAVFNVLAGELLHDLVGSCTKLVNGFGGDLLQNHQPTGIVFVVKSEEPQEHGGSTSGHQSSTSGGSTSDPQPSTSGESTSDSDKQNIVQLKGQFQIRPNNIPQPDDALWENYGTTKDSFSGTARSERIVVIVFTKPSEMEVTEDESDELCQVSETD